MSRESISTPSAPKPAGSYSQAIRANGFSFISVQTPRRSDGSRLSGAPFDEQALLAIENLAADEHRRARTAHVDHACRHCDRSTDLDDNLSRPQRSGGSLRVAALDTQERHPSDRGFDECHGKAIVG